jgi:ATP-binding cassette subfamily B protein
MKLPVRRYFALLLIYLKPQWLRTFLMIICLLAGIGFQLVNPQIISYFINTASVHGPASVLMTAGGLYMLAAFLNQIISVVATYCTEYVAWTATNQLRRDLMAHCMELDQGYHKAHTSGEMIERIDGDVDVLSRFFSQFSVNLMSNLLLLAVMLVLFFIMSWLVGVVMLAFAGLALLLASYLRKRAVPHWKEHRRMSAEYYGFLGERLSGLEDIRANGAEKATMRDFYQLLRTWLPINNLALRSGAEMGNSMLFFFVCGRVLALGLGFYLWSIKVLSLGAVYVLFAYTDALSQPLNAIQDEMQDLQQADACIQRIEQLLHTSSALTDTGTTILPEGALSVEFRGVSFGYETQETIIHACNLRIEPGRVLGILGRTGSGKTTLARLLFRLYDPQEGEVRVHNIPVHEISLSELRRHIGMVTQEVQIFHASLRDNLTFFARDIPDARIEAILAELGLSTWYHNLPAGLDTRLGNGEDERGLSGGEAQLLACARVFLANPGIVILDEASSRLDPATETLIERAITRVLAGKSALIIAHRLSTLQRADDILILAHGRMVEYGSRTALVNDPTSQFARLLNSENKEVLA